MADAGKWFLCVVTLLSSSVASMQGQALGKEYAKLLRQQGYQVLKAPRSDFGPGSLIPVDAKKNFFIASQSECFPDLDKDLNTGSTKLVDSNTVKNLTINASGNYSPTGSASFLSKLAGSFGFTSKATMDVAFGDTTTLNLTAVGLQNYLTGHKVSPACADWLRNPKTAVIFSVARVASMTYSFSGNRAVNASVNAAAVGQTITANSGLTYDSTTDNSVKITTPLFVAYNAFTLKDLKLEEAGDASGAARVLSITVTKRVNSSIKVE